MRLLCRNDIGDEEAADGVGKDGRAHDENTLSVHINNRLKGIVNHQLAIFQ